VKQVLTDTAGQMDSWMTYLKTYCLYHGFFDSGGKITPNQMYAYFKFKVLRLKFSGTDYSTKSAKKHISTLVGR